MIILDEKLSTVFHKKLFLFLKMENLQSVKNISVGWDILKRIVQEK